MTKGEIYNQLLDKVQAEGGYLKIEENSRPAVVIEMNYIMVAALFEMADNSSPLHLIDTNFHAWDVYDYLSVEDMEHILSRL